MESKKIHQAVISRYYWPGMEADIRKEKAQYNPIEVRVLSKSMSHAAKCAFISVTSYRCLIIIQLFQVTEPFELVGMDLMKLTNRWWKSIHLCDG